MSAHRYMRMCSLDAWQRDADAPKNCPICKAKFDSSIIGKATGKSLHHCRVCGVICCNDCSNNRLNLLDEAGVHVHQNQRVCINCVMRPSQAVEDALEALEKQKQESKPIPTLSEVQQKQKSQSQQRPPAISVSPQNVNNNQQQEAKSLGNSSAATSSPSPSSRNQQQNVMTEEDIFSPAPIPRRDEQQKPFDSEQNEQSNNSNSNNFLSPPPISPLHNDDDDQQQQEENISASATSAPRNQQQHQEGEEVSRSLIRSSLSQQEQENTSTSASKKETKSSNLQVPSSDPRRKYTQRILQMMIDPDWVQLRTPAHELSVPDLISSEPEVFSLLVPDTRTRAYRLTVDLDASLVGATMLISSVDMMAKCEPDVEERSVVALEGGGVVRVATKYKSTSLISGREFRTKSTHHELSEQEVASLVTLGLNELPISGYVTGSINDDDNTDEVEDGRVLGLVHGFGIVVCAVKQLNPVRRSSVVLRVSFISHTDPRGRLPVFALENPTLQELMRRLNLFTAVLHSLDLTVAAPSFSNPSSVTGSPEKKNNNNNNTATSSNNNNTPSAAAAVANNNIRFSTASSTTSALVFGSTSSECGGEGNALCPSRRKVIAPLLKLYNFAEWQPQQATSSSESSSSQFTIATAVVPRSRVKAHKVTCVIKCSLFTFGEIIGDAAMVCKYDPSIDEFEATRTVNAHVSSVYSSYKKASRILDCRDFAVASAQVFIGQEEITAELPSAPPSSRGAFLQNVVDSHIIPPKPSHVRGIVHSFGYVATTILNPDNINDDDDETNNDCAITVTLVSCVDPCGNIPNFLLDSQANESVRKLGEIKKLCEQKQMTSPARSKSVERFGGSSTMSRTSSVMSFASTQQQQQTPTPIHSNTSNSNLNRNVASSAAATTTTATAITSTNSASSPVDLDSLDSKNNSQQKFNSSNSKTRNRNNNDNNINNNSPSPSSPSSSLADFDDYVTCGGALESNDNFRNQDEEDRDDVLSAVVDLQRTSGWGNPVQMKGCRIESRATSLLSSSTSTSTSTSGGDSSASSSGIKAVRTYKEFKCNLDTFRSKLLDVQTMQSLDSSLENIEFLLSPSYGQVIYTSHKTGSVFISPREFCTISCHKQLSPEESANAGLCTPGMSTAVFVSATVDAPPGFNKTDVAKDHIRGKVVAIGYVALATPPTAKRIRVFNISCVDPCGQIPTKLVNAVIGENAEKLTKLAEICEKNITVASPSSSKFSSYPNSEVVANKNQKEEISTKNENESESASSNIPIQEVVIPLIHLSMNSTKFKWHPLASSTTRCKVEKTTVGGGEGSNNNGPTIFRVKVELKASLNVIASTLRSSQGLTKLLQPQSVSLLKSKQQQQQQKEQEQKAENNHDHASIVKLQLPSNQLGHKQSRSTTIVTDSRFFDEKEGPQHGLFTDGFHGAAFCWAGQSPPLDLEQDESSHSSSTKKENKAISFTEALGCIAVAVPVNAKRLRCSFWWSESMYHMNDEEAQQERGDVEQAAKDFAQGVVRFATFVENLQKEFELNPSSPDALRVAAQSNRVDDSLQQNNTSSSPVRAQTTQQQQQQQEETQQQQQETGMKSNLSSSSLTSSINNLQEQVQEQEEEIPQEEEEEQEPPKRALSLGTTPEQDRILKPLLELYNNNEKWSSPPKEAHGCTLQDMSVPYCDKKALKMEIVMRCSIYTFCRFINDRSLIPQYDPSMQEMKENSPSSSENNSENKSENDDVKTIYTSYKQASRFITARDFAFDSTQALLLSSDSRFSSSSSQQNQQNQQQQEILVSSSVHNKSYPTQNNFVRGILHVYGYIAKNLVGTNSSVGKIKVTCICCVDPSGRIPASLVDAAASENCKKLAMIRNICESLHAQKPLVDWFFDPSTGASTVVVNETNKKATTRKTTTKSHEKKQQEEKQQQETATAKTMLFASNSSFNLGGPVALPSAKAEEEETEAETNSSNTNGKQQQKSPSPSPKKRAVTENASIAQMRVLKPLLDLYRLEKWSSPPKEAHGCTLQDMSVPFCDKKALRMELVMRCSVYTFASVLLDPNFVKQYDPTLQDLKRVDEFGKNNNNNNNSSYDENISTFYQSSMKISRFISPRDFAFDTTISTMKTKEVGGSILQLLPSSQQQEQEQEQKQEQEEHECLVNSAIHNPSYPTDKTSAAGFVRGILHCYGYIACPLPPSSSSTSSSSQSENKNRIRVVCIACVDPCGKIPAAIVDAVGGENCKKLSVIRNICEKLEERGLKDWYF